MKSISTDGPRRQVSRGKFVESLAATLPLVRRWVSLAPAFGFLLFAFVGEAFSQSVKITQVGEWPGYYRGRPSPSRDGARSFVIADTNLYVVTRGGLSTLDISDPSRPKKEGAFLRFSSVEPIGFQGDAIVVTGYGLYVFRPSDFVKIGFLDSNIRFRGGAVGGGYAYVAVAENEFRVFDLSDPTKPVIVSTVTVGGGSTRKIVLSGDFAFATTEAGLEVIDISDPLSPVVVGDLETSGLAQDLKISGNYAYLAGTKLEIIDISDPEKPALAGEALIGEVAATSLAVANGRVYVTADAAGLQVFDISDPANPVKLGGYVTDGPALGVAVTGNYAYVAVDALGFQVVDVSDATQPMRVGDRYETSGYAESIVVSGNYAYVAEGTPGMRVIDISKPERPVLAGTYVQDVPRLMKRVAVSGDHAYLLQEESGFEVLNISNPAKPVRTGGANTTATGEAIAASGDHVYVAFGYSFIRFPDCETCHPEEIGGFEVFDVSNPPEIPRIGQYEGWTIAMDITVAGSYAYVAHREQLAVVDISNPEGPVKIGSASGGFRKIAVSETGTRNYAYDVRDGLLEVRDVRTPADPVVRGNIRLRGYPAAIAASEQTVYASGRNWLDVIDVSDPAKPVLAGSFATKGDGSDLTVVGNYIYLADGEWGLQIFRVDPIVDIQLNAEVLGDDLRLRWPAEAADLVLQSTASLKTPDWEDVLPAPVVQDGFYGVAVSLEGAAGFFRLERRVR